MTSPSDEPEETRRSAHELRWATSRSTPMFCRDTAQVHRLSAGFTFVATIRFRPLACRMRLSALNVSEYCRLAFGGISGVFIPATASNSSRSFCTSEFG